jgi:Tfp pilus assembly protein PilF
LLINPRYKEAYLERAYSKNNLEDYAGALADYGKALEIDPNYAEAYLNRGTLYYEMDRDAEACKDWRKAMNLGFKIAEQVVEANCKECNP